MPDPTCPAPADLARLLAATAAHDVLAFRQLYDAAWPRLMPVARRLMGDAASAEDVLQLTFVRVWQRAGAWDAARGSAIGWMLRICRNVALDELRRLRAERARDAHFAASHDTECHDAQSAANGFAGYLATLPPDQAGALAAVYVEGLSHTELARRSGVPLGTIKSRIRRALQTLRQQLNQQLSQPPDQPLDRGLQ